MLGDLASSDACLHYLVEKLDLNATVIKISDSWVLSSRSAAEIFVASVAMFKLSSHEDLFSSVMRCIVGQLVRASYLALEKESGGKFVCVIFSFHGHHPSLAEPPKGSSPPFLPISMR